MSVIDEFFYLYVTNPYKEVSRIDSIFDFPGTVQVNGLFLQLCEGCFSSFHADRIPINPLMPMANP